MTRLQQLKKEFKLEAAALDEKHRQHARLHPDSKDTRANRHESANLVSHHTRRISEWLKSPEGHTEHISETIAEVRDLEYRYRTVIEDPARAWFVSPVTPETIGIMRERQALYAAFVSLYDEQGAEAFIAAFEDRSGGLHTPTLASRLVRSYAGTEEEEKIDGPESRRGEQNDGGYYQITQTLDDPVVLSLDDPMVERQRNPPAKHKPLYEQTYEEYLEEAKAFQEREIHRYTEMMTHGLSRRMRASVKAELRNAQQSKPMTEPEKKQRETEMLMEARAGSLLSDRGREEGMKLIQDRLDWILIKIRKRQHTLEALCKEFKMPLVWGKALEVYAVGTGRITADEWQAAFKQPGRPKAVKPRGPYKKREAQLPSDAPQKDAGEPQAS